MKSFPAWLAMDGGELPRLFSQWDGHRQQEYVIAYVSSATGLSPVLIVADTSENRKKLGMEEM